MQQLWTVLGSELPPGDVTSGLLNSEAGEGPWAEKSRCYIWETAQLGGHRHTGRAGTIWWDPCQVQGQTSRSL